MAMNVRSRQPQSREPLVLGDRGHREVDPDLRRRVDRRLGELIPAESDHPEQLHRAMRYSLLAGGKRIRPVLAIQVARAFQASEDEALDPACAIEMVHTASLILDDLPCMDDAALRRGAPTNHRQFGEDTAILAATALLNRAFAVVAECEAVNEARRLALVRLLSEAVGSNGIIAGQFCDLRGEWRDHESLNELLEMYSQKTGALFVAAVEAGARVAGVEEAWVQSVRGYATNLGLAFQILDDLLDTLTSGDEIGKDTGQDHAKHTLVARLGPDAARLEVCRYVKSAAAAIEPLGEAGGPLVDLARSYIEPTLERVLYL
jgi:geranylgeranyl diphosphate synthase type II